MIARGDLAVELGHPRLAEIQKKILWLCEAARVPVVWATQVLDDLVREGLPSRAETTDPAMSQRNLGVTSASFARSLSKTTLRSFFAWKICLDDTQA
jgi:hypothetical protein